MRNTAPASGGPASSGGPEGSRPFRVDTWAGPQHSRRTAALLYGGAAAGVIALHLATIGTLGFHTDELYYLASGRHPALGYSTSHRSSHSSLG
jgi:hypothetical protein